MTVGIVLEFMEKDERKGVVIVSDRMVSSGEWGVEMPAQKPYLLYSGEEMQVMAVGAGSVSHIAEYMFRARSELQLHPPSQLDGVMKICNDIFLAMIREILQRNYLDPLGISLRELISSDITRTKLYEEVQFRLGNNVIPQFLHELAVLVAVVSKDDSLIFTLDHSLRARMAGKVGFDAIGSGFESADWTLMHRQFNPKRDMLYSLFLGVYAKIQAEESAGVGRETDAYVIHYDRVEEVPQQVLNAIRREFEHEKKREKLNLEKAISRMRGGENEWKKI